MIDSIAPDELDNTCDPYILEQIARNEPLSDEGAIRLAGCRFKSVRSSIERRQNIPMCAQEILAIDKDTSVRRILAFNKTLSPDVRSLLTNDDDESVRENSIKTNRQS